MAAGKQVPLSIVLRTVDKATAGIQAFNKKLEAELKPRRDFNKAFEKLKENLDAKYGFSKVVDGFKGVGNAVEGLAGKLAVIGGVVGVAVAGVLSLVDHFDQLGDTADRLGTSADFLAAFRFAAERAGAPLEAVDASLQTLVTNMGAAKAGTGKMLKFLNQISPVLAKQVTSANSLEEALGLLADATAKLPDAARRSKLAAATLGDAALAPLLARGAAGVQDLLTEFQGLAGNLGDATEAAGKTDDAMKRFHASSEGVKAALVSGLAPAFTVVIEKMTAWLVDHRQDIARWAADIGEKLPGAVDRVVEAVTGAVRDVSKFIDRIGGWKVAAAGVALVMSGPLLSAIGGLSTALLTTPFGQMVASIGLATAALYELLDAFDLLDERQGKSKPAAGVGGVRGRMAIPGAGAGMDRWAATASSPVGPQIAAAQGVTGYRGIIGGRNLDLNRVAIPPELRLQPPAAQATQATIKVDITGAPKGTRATIEPGSSAKVDLSVGHQMGGY